MTFDSSSLRRRLSRPFQSLTGRVAGGEATSSPSGGFPMPMVDLLPDDELERLNTLLPWASFLVDRHGRQFGSAYSKRKRFEPQVIPDSRIVELNARMSLDGAHVLEVGCFEGIHTVGLCGFAANVTAIDSRIENVVKTIVRCALLGHRPEVLRVDVEEPPPDGVDLSCDVMSHVGVLYHLSDPIRHLAEFAPLVSRGLMLDTHVAPTNEEQLLTYQAGGREWRYHRFAESGRAAPFAGMKDHAKWLVLDDLVDFLGELGFASVDVAEQRAERNGPRVLIYAER